MAKFDTFKNYAAMVFDGSSWLLSISAAQKQYKSAL